jgi:FkbM family methyltransferase
MGMPHIPHFRRLHFSLKDRIVSFLSETFFENNTYTVRHGLIQGMKRKGGLGFLPGYLARPGYVKAEEDFLRGLDFNGKVVYDIGAFQGIMTLFFAARAKAVVTYEPLPAHYRRVLENIALNKLANVRVLNKAVGNKEGSLLLAFDPRMPGAASGDAIISAQITSSIAEAATVEVPVVRLDDEVERSGLPPADFIKIDIEGMELAALEGMECLLTRRHPALYIELHGATEEDKRERARQIVQFLSRLGYDNIHHVESGSQVTTLTTSTIFTGHLHGTAGGQSHPGSG